MAENKDPEVVKQRKMQAVWLVYTALIIAGLLLLADAFHILHLAKWTAKVGVCLLFSAVALIIGNGRPAGYIATGIVWLAVIATLFY